MVASAGVRAAVGRAGAALPRERGHPANAPALRNVVAPSAAPLAPWLADVAAPDAGIAGLCRKTDCLRGFIDADVIADAERRAARIAAGAPMWKGGGPQVAILAGLYGTSVVIGYCTSAFLGWFGLARRNLLSTAWVLLLTPLHWLMLSLAAWRALGQLIVAPYAREKTKHGRAKNSRLAANMTKALLELKRYLSELRQAGALPELAEPPTYISADRRRRRRASG
jgi:hypothetical protein